MWDRKEVKARGKESFKRSYWKSVIVSILCMMFFASAGTAYKTNSEDITQQLNNSGLSDGELVAIALIIFGIVSFALFIATILDIFVFNPIEFGCSRFFLVNQDENAEFAEILHAFKTNYLNTVLAAFLKNLIIIIGFCLFVIPGIILLFSYRMVPYILADDPSVGAVEALKKSRSMMSGQKWKVFVYDLSYILWYILSGITFGLLAIFYVNPWKYNADAALYKAIKG